MNSHNLFLGSQRNNLAGLGEKIQNRLQSLGEFESHIREEWARIRTTSALEFLDRVEEELVDAVRKEGKRSVRRLGMNSLRNRSPLRSA